MTVPIIAAMGIIVSMLMAKRIDDTSSTASAKPRRWVLILIPVVLLILYPFLTTKRAARLRAAAPSIPPSNRHAGGTGT
jgi:hypothetical protein